MQACLPVWSNSRGSVQRALSPWPTGGKLLTSVTRGAKSSSCVTCQHDPEGCLGVPHPATVGRVFGRCLDRTCNRSQVDHLHKENAPLAQLAEQLTLNQRVVGSSPTGGTFAYCSIVSHIIAQVHNLQRLGRFLLRRAFAFPFAPRRIRTPRFAF